MRAPYAVTSNGSLANKKAFVRGFVQDIRVTGEKAVLSYSPLRLKQVL
ncbi:hypothetical protein ACFLWS_07770 [Chloroflexota bacterium]